MTADHALVERMIAGDERALGELYDRYARTAYALAFAIVGDRDDAEEVVVDAFGQVWRGASAFDPARGSLAAWLTTITRTRALDLVRARGRRVRASLRAAQSNDAAPEPADRALERSDAHRVVSGALGALTEPQRRVIELAYFDGMSQSEIAVELGEPLGTVKTRIRTALERLRGALTATLRSGT